jgi:hypothetical protein
LSEVIGSWKIIEISLPRILRICGVGLGQEVLAHEADLAADDLAGRARDQAQDRERRHALAAARFADDAERLPRPDLERHAVDGLDRAVVGEEVGLEVLTSSTGDRPSGLASEHLAGIEGVGQAVAEEVVRQHGQEDEQPGTSIQGTT